VRTKSCGICGTDLHAARFTREFVSLAQRSGGRWNMDTERDVVFGHEFVGEVVANGPGTEGKFKPGQLVTSMPLTIAGSTILGMGYNPDVPGGFAEYTSVHLNEAVHLPDAVSWEHGALVEPLAVALHAVRKLNHGLAGKNVLVMGAGPIGLACVLWASFFGARHVIVSELDPGRAKLAAAFGATGLVDATGDVGEQFRTLTGSAPELILECVGVPGMIGQAMELAPYGGELLIVGFCMKPDSFLPAIAMVKELAVQFVIAYDKSDFQFVVDMLAADRIKVDGMITDIVPFSAFPTAFEALRRPTSQCKILLNPMA
jgi:(R,R)-butanediol dehydrogenase/meso-butanediol dehydrogenase/diacetyl reductase